MTARFVDGPPDIANIEGLSDYDIRWPWTLRPRLTPGTTTVLRVKNEARSMRWMLPSMLDATQQVVLVDNQSDDGTAEVARKVAAKHGAEDRLTIMDYPFRVSRCGPEHLATPERSVHSLAYYYNWAFSHVQTAYSLKWDGDMVLTAEGVAVIDALGWQVQSSEAIIKIPRHPLFVANEQLAYLDLGWRNMEFYGYPMSPEHTFVKAFEWEMRIMRPTDRIIRAPEGLAVELKYLDADEISHWTSPDAFATSPRTARKRREWEVFSALSAGREEDVERVVRIESPHGTHVVDYVTQHWLPNAERPLVDDIRGPRP
jgi:hypothetical protein